MRFKKILPALIILSIFLPIFNVSAIEITIPPAKTIKILLVPGHDDEVWGAQYGNMKEADMNLALATQIYNILKKDKRFEVHITRDGGTPLGYTQEFADYFTNHWNDIIAFEKSKKAVMQNEISTGSFVQKESVPHHTVSSDVAIRLYGFNKWADDNNMDAVIHIHFNDYPRKTSWTIGKYTGFTVYYPDGEMDNFKESANLAADIFSQMHKVYHTSTYPPERGGLMPDQSLIAMGSNGTLLPTVRSVLIEYGYIYEKKFRTKSTRLAAYKNMATLTAQGIKNYFK